MLRDFCIRVRLGRNGEEEEEVKARCHYRAAKVEGIVYNLRDDVYVVVIVFLCLSTCLLLKWSIFYYMFPVMLAADEWLLLYLGRHG